MSEDDKESTDILEQEGGNSMKKTLNMIYLSGALERRVAKSGMPQAIDQGEASLKQNLFIKLNFKRNPKSYKK